MKKVIIVEPGVTRTNFGNDMVVMKKSQEPDSPYLQMMQKIATGFGNMVKNGSSPELVAKVVLNSVRDKNPNLRYLAGNDIERTLGSKGNMSDEEFSKVMKQNLMM
jgi:hypothetical protein